MPRKKIMVYAMALLFVAVIGFVVFAPGKISELTRGCRPTALTLTPIRALLAAEPITLEARLTADGQPLTGAGISFFVIGNGPNGWTGQSIGGADTDTNGVARLKLPGGLSAVVPSSYKVTGYQAEFRITSSVDNPKGEYCRVVAKNELTN